MKRPHHTIFLALLLLLGISAPALADVEHIGGYAQANRLYADGWDGVRFDVMSPFFPLEDALISMTLKVKTKDGQMPENIVCSLRRDFRYVPADQHAAPGEDGGLGISFARLDSYTHIQFIVVWEDDPNRKVYPHSATIHASGPDWERSAERKFGSFYRESDGTPVQIVIDGPEDCRLM